MRDSRAVSDDHFFGEGRGEVTVDLSKVPWPTELVDEFIYQTVQLVGLGPANLRQPLASENTRKDTYITTTYVKGILEH